MGDKRCSTCVHWNAQWPERIRGREFGCCYKITTSEDDADLRAVILGEGGGLYTSPDFGCIQHEERDDGTTHEG